MAQIALIAIEIKTACEVRPCLRQNPTQVKPRTANPTVRSKMALLCPPCEASATGPKRIISPTPLKMLGHRYTCLDTASARRQGTVVANGGQSENYSALERKLGSNLGPISAEYHAFGSNKTHHRPKRINNLANRLLLRDQGVGGSNPLSPTIKSRDIS